MEYKDGLSSRTKENINFTFQRTLGMSYEDFSLLDIDEQQRLIHEYHKMHPRKDKHTEIVMIGSGESALFVKMKKGEKVLVTSGDSSIMTEVGLTREDQDRRLNGYFDKSSPSKIKQLIKRRK